MDVPRLSTLQALLIILKAREAAPKRGYYFRSWMTVVSCVQMAKDLDWTSILKSTRLADPVGLIWLTASPKPEYGKRYSFVNLWLARLKVCDLYLHICSI